MNEMVTAPCCSMCNRALIMFGDGAHDLRAGRMLRIVGSDRRIVGANWITLIARQTNHLFRRLWELGLVADTILMHHNWYIGLHGHARVIQGLSSCPLRIVHRAIPLDPTELHAGPHADREFFAAYQCLATVGWRPRSPRAWLTARVDNVKKDW